MQEAVVRLVGFDLNACISSYFITIIILAVIPHHEAVLTMNLS